VAIAPEVGIVKRHTQKASAKELFDFLKKHYPDGDYLAVYESGFSGFATYYALKDVGLNCIVIHATDVPTTQYEEMRKEMRQEYKRIIDTNPLRLQPSKPYRIMTMMAMSLLILR